MTKYYMAHIMERSGDKEYNEDFLVAVAGETKERTKEIMRELWLSWYEEYESEDDVDFFESNCYWNHDSLI